MMNAYGTTEVDYAVTPRVKVKCAGSWENRFAEWLDPELTDKAHVQQLLNSLPEPTLTPRIVSPRVNSVRNNGPELIELAEEG